MQCDGGCNKWYHMYCVGLVKNQIKPDDDYVCRKCKKQSGALDTDVMDTSAAPALSSAFPPHVPLTSSKTKSRFEEDYPDDDDDGEDDEDEDEEDDDDEDDDTAAAPSPADAKVSSPVRTTPTPTGSTPSSLASNSLKTKANSDPPTGSSSSKKQKI